ncbi:MAG: hypothetical protein Q4F38_06090 [Akkermansia sp.]|nr:hypothetical protein [Akkermansia sp.]
MSNNESSDQMQGEKISAPVDAAPPQKPYDAILSKYFTSFSGVVTKKEFREFFWTSLAYNMFYLRVGIIRKTTNL